MGDPMARSGSRASHTILLLQTAPQDLNSRVYLEYSSPTECVIAIQDLFEAKLKLEQPGKSTIQYDIGQLFSYIDQMPDMAVLVFQAQRGMYEPFDKRWIKEEMVEIIRDKKREKDYH